MATSNYVLNCVREATHQIHQRLEQHLDVVAVLSDPAGRGALAARYHRFHAGIEGATQDRLQSAADLDFAARQRSPSITGTLAELGEPVPPTPFLSRPAGLAEALGLFYVAEGSSLGGRLLHRELAARGVDPIVFGFLNPYGERTGERWRAFLAILERDARDDVDGAVSGAVAGFNFAQDTLVTQAVAA